MGIKDNKYLIFIMQFQGDNSFTFSKKENNKWFLSGAFLFDDTITHTLEEIQETIVITKNLFLINDYILLILFLQF